MTRPIVLRRASRDRLELGAPLRPRAGLLIGMVLLLAAGVPLFSPEFPTQIQLGVAFGLAALAIWLIRSNLFDRASAVTVEHGVLRASSRRVPLSHARSVALTGRVATDDGLTNGCYAAELLLVDSERTRLLAHGDPARVLKDLSLILGELHVPVKSGWGLSESALAALLGPTDPARALPASEAARVHSSQPARRTLYLEASPVEPRARRSAMMALLVAGVLLACLFTFFVASASRAPHAMHGLSLILPAGTSLLVIGLGLFVATRRLRVSYDGELQIETRALGFPLRRLRVPATTLLGAWAVSPDGGPALHVLIATDSGPLAIRCPTEAARELAAELSRSLGRGAPEGA